MSFYVPGTIGSKWRNPLSVKKYGREGCLERYEAFIRNHPTMYGELEELGCWCAPEGCWAHYHEAFE
jgi:hypothetical protein